jgi:murein DD-endopeptidase MepM/ murein hydrolase activator NlpD
VYASNRGIVALTDDFLLAGGVVYLDHGAGVVTGYFHLSKALVSAGDTVSRGQAIALVGASGRVTGSHLHWAARYGSFTVNGMDLVNLDARWIRAK